MPGRFGHPTRPARPARLARHARALRLTHLALAVALLAAVGCRGGRSALPAPTLAADSSRAEAVAPGVTHRTYFIGAGPWVVHALDVDRAQCWSPTPLKAGSVGPGREMLSKLAADQATGEAAFGGAVNADFFLFAPDGVPTGPHVQAGTVLFGPGTRDVFAVDAKGRAHITRLSVDGWLVAGRDSVRITRWNRVDANTVAVLDRAYGERVDSAHLGFAFALRRVSGSAHASMPLASGREERMVATGMMRSGADPAPLPNFEDALVVAGRGTSDSVRALLERIARGVDTVRLRVAMQPFHPRIAVGGNGVLLHEGAIPARLDSVGNEGFRNRNPRTAIGYDREGRRLLLVTIDGRQPGYSVGTTLRETATLMRQLGATEALNLDGGGSSTFVVPDMRSPTGVTIANRPSDKTERRVANGLAVVKQCNP